MTLLQTTMSFATITLFMAIIAGCKKGEPGPDATAVNNGVADSIAASNQDVVDSASETASVMFEFETNDHSCDYVVNNSTYLLSDLAEPLQLNLGKHVLEVLREGHGLFEVPFEITSSKEVVVIVVPDRVRRSALAILDAGGHVIFSDLRNEAKEIDELPEEYFDFAGVGFYGKDFDDSVLRELNDVRLRRLDVSFSSITDEGIRAIGDFSQLEQLGLNRTKVSVDGLRLIADGSPPLKHVLVDGLELPETFLLHLRNCPLGLFSAVDTNLGDKDLDALKGKDLFFCHLDGTEITDSGLRSLSGSKFGTLSLSNTAISDEGIKHCLQIDKLEEIILKDTQATESSVQLLRQHFPGIKVTL